MNLNPQQQHVMKQTPILFSTAMVQAILEGRKTQTRRVVKPQPDADCPPQKVPMYSELEPHWGKFCITDIHGESHLLKCPYGQPGDVLWVRETWQHTKVLNINPEDDNYGYVYKADRQPWEDFDGWTWKPSLFMPKEACRLFLRVTNVRVERLQDISDDDACEEGIDVKTIQNADAGDYNCYPRNYMISEKEADGWPYLNEEQYVESFATLWYSINGEQSWRDNPWVWVVEFERIEKP